MLIKTVNVSFHKNKKLNGSITSAGFRGGMDASDAGDAQSVVALWRRDVEVVAAPEVLCCAIAAVGVA